MVKGAPCQEIGQNARGAAAPAAGTGSSLFVVYGDFTLRGRISVILAGGTNR